MILQTQNLQRKYSIDFFVPLVIKAIECTFKNEKIGLYVEENAIIPVFSITFTNNKKIREMNYEYRGIDKKTDVLSFPLIEANGKIINKVPKNELFINNKNELELNFGDIVLSLEKAYEQSKEFNHSIEREITFLIVHSVLHLIGYDHIDPKDEKKMILHQKQIMQNLYQRE